MRAAEERLAENESELRRALDSGPAATQYREATDQAVARYNDAVDTQYTRYSDIAAIEGEREELLGALYGYQLAWETFRSGLSDGCRLLVERVSVRFALKSENIALPRDDIIDAFTNNVRREYDSPELLEECKQRFAMVRLERPVTDVHKLKGEIELKVSMTPEVPGSRQGHETPTRGSFAAISTKGASA